MRLGPNCYFTLLLCLFLVPGPAGADEYPVPPGGLHVEDGDTVLIEFDGKEQRVQLEGIDAPEDGDNPKLQRDLARTGLERERLLALGRLSTEYLRRLTRIGEPYSLHYAPDRRDRYGRIVGDLRDARGRSLSETILVGGYAIVANRTDTDLAERLRPLEAEAERSRVGLWALDPEATRAWAGKGPPDQ